MGINIYTRKYKPMKIILVNIYSSEFKQLNRPCIHGDSTNEFKLWIFGYKCSELITHKEAQERDHNYRKIIPMIKNLSVTCTDTTTLGITHNAHVQQS